ncbi:MAG: hypothetical protein LBG59_01560 [Candidatus Peribacteria bacterium]|nr:hypothetical protein [Candidatus Peribacteria bacterium]
MFKKIISGIVILSIVLFIAGCNNEDSFRSHITESKAEQLLSLLNETPSKEGLEKLKSLVREFSENDIQEFSKLYTIDDLKKMQEREYIASYSEDDVSYLSQKLFEFYRRLYKLTGKRNQFALTAEEVNAVGKDEDVQQVLYEIRSYVDALRPHSRS